MTAWKVLRKRETLFIDVRDDIAFMQIMNIPRWCDEIRQYGYAYTPLTHNSLWLVLFKRSDAICRQGRMRQHNFDTAAFVSNMCSHLLRGGLSFIYPAVLLLHSAQETGSHPSVMDTNPTPHNTLSGALFTPSTLVYATHQIRLFKSTAKSCAARHPRDGSLATRYGWMRLGGSLRILYVSMIRLQILKIDYKQSYMKPVPSPTWRII